MRAIAVAATLLSARATVNTVNSGLFRERETSRRDGNCAELRATPRNSVTSASYSCHIRATRVPQWGLLFPPPIFFFIATRFRWTAWCHDNSVYRPIDRLAFTGRVRRGCSFVLPPWCRLTGSLFSPLTPLERETSPTVFAFRANHRSVSIAR